MKQRFTNLATTGTLISAFLLVTPISANPAIEKVDEEGKETFFYNKGFRNGYKEGEKEGYKKGLAKAEAAISQYKKKIEALESGKYLTKRHKVTPPRVYQQKNEDGTVSVVVKGCSIEKQLTPEEILMLPEIEKAESSYNSHAPSGTSSYAKRNSHAPSDNIFLPGIDPSDSITPSLGGEDMKVVYKTFPDTEFFRKLFRASGRPFSVIGGDKIKVIFPSEQEAESFCVRHNLNPGKDVL
ncbi:MAG TPA: hypothetical protein ENN12_03495 [Epsilonproteobacteria bacterium]|nr:hypothetical protein [Campylobacterota bacterium]